MPKLPYHQPDQSSNKVMLRFLWTDWSHKLRRSSKKNRQASEQEGAQLSTFSTLEYPVRYTCNTSKAFIDFNLFKKAFNRVWHAALWATMRLYNINDKPDQNHRMPLQQGDQRSLSWQHRKMVSNHNWSAPRMSALPHPLQHLWIMADTLEDHAGTVSIGGKIITNLCFADNIFGWHPWRPWRNSQYWRQDNYKLMFCWQHWRPSWTTAKAGQVGKSSWRGLHSTWHADQCREDLVEVNTNGISTNITIDNKQLEPSVALNIWELLYPMRDPSLKYSPE